MDASEPHAVRHRGFFLHSDTGEPDSAEHENPEGLVVRVRVSRGARRAVPRQMSGIAVRSGRSMTSTPDEGNPQIRSGSVTGSRQRGHLPR
jgi:hypothetical protein